MRPERYLSIDLHGLSVAKTKELLKNHFDRITEDKITEFIIITGRGNHIAPDGSRGVLRKILPKLLEPYCDEISEISPDIGSYKIRLKKNSQDVSKSLSEMLNVIVDSNDPEKHLSYLKKLEAQIEAGDSGAMIIIANMHLIGEIKGFNDKEKGILLLNKAKELGNLDAYTELGSFFLEGRYVKKNIKKGLRLLNVAAKTNPIAQFTLAKSYILGEPKKDDEKALFWMKKSAESAYPMAELNLGFTYFEGNFTPVDFTQAFHYFSLAANHGNVEAMSYLARCHACGYGTTINYFMAFTLYNEAAKFDDIYAIYQIGQYYATGRSVDINDKLAFQYFLRGANLNDGDCQAKVAYAYFFSLGIEKDIDEGLKWLEKSVEQKSAFGYYLKSFVYKKGIGLTVDLALEEKFLVKSAEKDWSQAQFELGIGILGKRFKGTEQNGLSWIQKAVEDDYPQAIEFMQSYQQFSEKKKGSDSKMSKERALFKTEIPEDKDITKMKQIITKVKKTLLTSGDIVNRVEYPYFYGNHPIPEKLSQFKMKLNKYREEISKFIVYLNKSPEIKQSLPNYADCNDLSNGSFYHSFVLHLAMAQFGIGECGECTAQTIMEMIYAGYSNCIHVSIRFTQAQLGMENFHSLVVTNVPQLPASLMETNLSIQEFFARLPKQAIIADGFLGLCFYPNAIPEALIQYISAYGGEAQIYAPRHFYNLSKKSFSSYVAVAKKIYDNFAKKSILPELGEFSSLQTWQKQVADGKTNALTLTISSAKEKDYLYSLRAMLGSARGKDIVRIDEKASVVSFPSFWLRQLPEKATDELSKNLSVEASVFKIK